MEIKKNDENNYEIINEELSSPSIKSSSLLNEITSVLIIIDMQDRILNGIENRQTIYWNTKRLIKVAQIMRLSTFYSEQVPEKLGGTSKGLKSSKHCVIYRKNSFSLINAKRIFNIWEKKGVENLIICGIETHICIQQSVIDLLSLKYNIFLAADAVGSRNKLDHEFALKRMDKLGCTISTTEAIMFELCKSSKNNVFKEISNLAKASISSQDNISI